MPSTVIRQFSYAPQERRLTVTFVTGRVYEYFDVSSAVAEDFRAAFSKGAFFNRNVRDRYRCREVPADEPGLFLRPEARASTIEGRQGGDDG